MGLEVERKPEDKSQVRSGGQAGQILASLQAQSDGIETLPPPPLTLLAAGSVDGSIAPI
jgi:ribosome assembly protein SQT1